MKIGWISKTVYEKKNVKKTLLLILYGLHIEMIISWIYWVT